MVNVPIGKFNYCVVSGFCNCLIERLSIKLYRSRFL